MKESKPGQQDWYEQMSYEETARLGLDGLHSLTHMILLTSATIQKVTVAVFNNMRPECLLFNVGLGYATGW